MLGNGVSNTKEVSSCCLLSRDRSSESSKWYRVIPNLMWVGISSNTLFLTMRARPDIRLTTSFPCTRAKDPTTHDWFKLTRVMNFLKATAADCLIIEMDGSGKAVCGIDAAHAVHPDARSHTGMSMKMGKGAITSMSSKQKLNTRSSTEAEVVAVDDCMSQVL